MVIAAVVAKRTEVALSIVSVMLGVIPTYYVHNYEVPARNWDLGSMASLSTGQSAFISAVWAAHPNASKFDALLPAGLSLTHLSLFPPGIALEANTSEIYHSGIKLDDPLTKKKTHDYMLVSSPRKVKDKTVGIMLLARVPTQFELWPEGVEDYSFDLATASNIVAPPTLSGELRKLDKGPAMDHLKKKCAPAPPLLRRRVPPLS